MNLRWLPHTFVALGLSAAGCGSTPMHPTVRREATFGGSGVVNGETVSDTLRILDETPASTDLRARRDALARYMAMQGLQHLDDANTEGAIRDLRTALTYYDPHEVAAGGLPRELAPLARGIFEQVAPRGDEADALAAARVLALVAHPDGSAASRYREAADWGDRNRHEFRQPWVYKLEEAEIYRQVAAIVPTPELVQQAADLLVQAHEAAMLAAMAVRPGASMNGRRLTYEDMQALQHAMRDTAAPLAMVYLRIGDIQGAADAVGRIHDAPRGLLDALHSLASGEGGAEGLIELAGQLERLHDWGAVQAICRRGRRTYPTDSHFPHCLARAAAQTGMLGLASAHLEAAVALSPNDPTLLELALQVSREWLASELANDDPGPGRRAYARTRALLTLWAQRNPVPSGSPAPGHAAPVAASDLEDLGAQLELAQANLDGAAEHLRRATQLQPPTRSAYLTLGEIAWRRNDPHHAIELLQQGLALPVSPTESDSTFRPLFQLRIGLAAQSSGDTALAQQQLALAANSFEALSRSLPGNQAAEVYMQHAMALQALGQPESVRHELDAALNAMPDSRDLAAQAIVFALSYGRFADAHDLVRAARGRLQLDRTWQVYFNLWSSIAARLGHLERDRGTDEILAQIASAAGEHAPWTARLAQRYVGAIDRDRLFSYAQTVGQRTEANFYEAMLELASGDLGGAQRDLRAAVASNMLRYFEYGLAWDLLARGVERLAPGAGASTAPSPSLAIAVAPTIRNAPPVTAPAIRPSHSSAAPPHRRGGH